jgi:hypothetical protein
MASKFIAKLDAISGPGTPWKTFIQKLGPIHAQWHSEHNAGTADLGFLLFHWELIRRFKRVGADAGLGGITPFSLAELQHDNATYNVADTVSKGDVASMETFSSDLEAWHNDAHMNIGMAIHKNLMNPRTNVRIPQFWRLHYFINDRFEEQLKKFGASGATPADVVALLEPMAQAPEV